jgi:hypothetical protein
VKLRDGKFGGRLRISTKYLREHYIRCAAASPLIGPAHQSQAYGAALDSRSMVQLYVCWRLCGFCERSRNGSPLGEKEPPLTYDWCARLTRIASNFCDFPPTISFGVLRSMTDVIVFVAFLRSRRPHASRSTRFRNTASLHAALQLALSTQTDHRSQ